MPDLDKVGPLEPMSSYPAQEDCWTVHTTGITPSQRPPGRNDRMGLARKHQIKRKGLGNRFTYTWVGARFTNRRFSGHQKLAFVLARVL